MKYTYRGRGRSLKYCRLLRVGSLLGDRSSFWQAMSCVAVAAILTGTIGCQQHQRRIVGYSVEERPSEVEVFGQGSDVILIMGGIHGDERSTVPMVRQLSAHLAGDTQLLRGRQVVLMAPANPDGYAHNSRHNVNDVDLNRNFPAENFSGRRTHGTTALSQPESRAIKAVLDQYRPDRIVSIHQPVACIDYDGPAEELARFMGASCDLPVKRIGSRPGSLGSFAGLTLGVPIITFELPASADALDENALWETYGAALRAAILFSDTQP